MSKEVTEVETVKVKIAKEKNMSGFLIADAGKQVEMNKKDLAYVERAFKQFVKAQEILEKYSSNN